MMEEQGVGSLYKPAFKAGKLSPSIKLPKNKRNGATGPINRALTRMKISADDDSGEAISQAENFVNAMAHE